MAKCLFVNPSSIEKYSGLNIDKEEASDIALSFEDDGDFYDFNSYFVEIYNDINRMILAVKDEMREEAFQLDKLKKKRMLDALNKIKREVEKLKSDESSYEKLKDLADIQYATRMASENIIWSRKAPAILRGVAEMIHDEMVGFDDPGLIGMSINIMKKTIDRIKKYGVNAPGDVELAKYALEGRVKEAYNKMLRKIMEETLDVENGMVRIEGENGMEKIPISKAVDMLLEEEYESNNYMKRFLDAFASMGMRMYSGKKMLSIENFLREYMKDKENKFKAKISYSMSRIGELKKKMDRYADDNGMHIDGNRSYLAFVSEDGKIRTYTTREFDMYKEMIVADMASSGDLTYDSLREKFDTIALRDIIRADDNLSKRHKRVLGQLIGFVKGRLEEGGVSEDNISKVEEAIREALDIGKTEYMDGVSKMMDRDEYPVVVSEAMKLMEKVEDEILDLSHILDITIGEGEYKGDIDDLIDKIKDYAKGMIGSNKDLNEGVGVSSDDFILLPKDGDPNRDRFVDEVFERNKSNREYVNIIAELYSINRELASIAPPTYKKFLDSGDFLYLSSEYVSMYGNKWKNLILGYTSWMEVESNVTSKEYNERKTFKINDINIGPHGEALSIIKNSFFKRVGEAKELHKYTESLSDKDKLDVDRVAEALSRVSEDDAVAYATRFGLDMKSLQVARREDGTYNLGKYILLQARKDGYKRASHNLPLVMMYYAMTMTRYRAAATTVEEVNAILDHAFTENSRQRDRIAKLIGVTFLGEDKKYDGQDELYRALSLFTKKHEMHNFADPSKLAASKQDLLRLHKEFVSSEYFEKLKDTEAGKAFAKAVEDKAAVNRVRLLALAEGMNGVVRTIGLVGNVKSAFMNLFHGITSNFVATAKGEVNEESYTEALKFMLHGGMVSKFNPELEVSKRYMKIKKFLINYGIVNSFFNKSSLLGAKEALEALGVDAQGMFKKLGQPLWMQEKAEWIIQGSMAVAYLMDRLSFKLTKEDGSVEHYDLFDAIDENGNLKEEFMSDPENVNAFRVKLPRVITEINKILTKYHGQYGTQNYFLADGTTAGKLMSNLKKWLYSSMYERFHDKRYVISIDEEGKRILKLSEGRFRSIDLGTLVAAGGMLTTIVGSPWILAGIVGYGMLSNLGGRGIVSGNIAYAMKGMLSSLAMPVDIALKLLGSKKTIASVLLDGHRQKVNGNMMYRIQNYMAFGREMGFIMLAFLLKDLMYAMVKHEDDEESKKKKVNMIFQGIASNYIGDLMTLFSPFNSTATFIDPSIRHTLERTFEVLGDLFSGNEGRTYRYGVWEGYNELEKKFIYMLPKSFRTLFSPSYMFGLGTMTYYNPFPLSTDVENSRKIRRQIKKFGRNKGALERALDLTLL